MRIDILQLVDGAKLSRGLTVIIDVFRAFSLACYLFDRGVKEIIPVGTTEQAFKLKEANPGAILIGERNNQKIKGFDFGNSPFQTRDFDFRGKTVVHTTSAGTQGLIHATNADEVITGSFVNAQAVIDYIRAKNPSVVSLVCMGYAAKYPVEEDTFCAEYIRNGLRGDAYDFISIIDIIRNTSGKRFFIPENQEFSPKEDFFYCMNLNHFNFILKAERNGQSNIILRKKILKPTELHKEV
ncbi:MAG: 2-phosphosulfolactate phosphatase [Bacteroidales bacterium]|nr:2-phosphosulfolactate phosphatase [Bacteroidales bacterium]